jgi:hypothetical protein
MNEEALNMSLRKFLKVVGVTSQQEIEKAIRAAVADGRLKGTETLPAKMVLTIGKVSLEHTINGDIELA